MFTYSGNPGDSKLDEVRFKIGDTAVDFALLQDEEIEFLLASNDDNVINTCIGACRAIIAKLSKEVDYKLGPESVNASDRCKQYQSLLSTLKGEKITSTAYIITGDLCNHYPNFSIGMNDNTPWTHK